MRCDWSKVRGQRYTAKFRTTTVSMDFNVVNRVLKSVQITFVQNYVSECKYHQLVYLCTYCIGVLIRKMDPHDQMSFISPHTRAGHVAASRGRYLVVWGGYRDVTTNFVISRYLPPNHIWVYDTLLEKWRLEYTTGYGTPGTSGCGSVLVDNTLYIIGGHCDEHSPSGNTNAVYKLDLRSRTWYKPRTSGDHPLPCDKMTSWMHEGKIFIFGGFGLNPNMYHFSSNIEKFDFVPDDNSHSLYPRGWNNQLVVFDRATNCWSWPKCKGPKPIARAAHASAKLGNIIYTFGGRHQNLRMNDMHCLDLTTMTWSGNLPIAEPIPCGRSWHSLNVLSDTQLVLFGGFSQICEALNDCWIFETRYIFWTRVIRPGLQPRLWHTACVNDQGALIIIGGCTENILNDTTTYADNLITLYFSPKSLLRISLDAVFFNRKLLRPLWGELPQSIQRLLFDKLNTSPV